MATLSQTTKDRVRLHLGYTSAPNTSAFLGQLDRVDYTDAETNRFDAIVAALDKFDTNLATNPDLGFTVQSGRTILDYRRSEMLIRKEASRQLQELSVLVNAAIIANKYVKSRKKDY